MRERVERVIEDMIFQLGKAKSVIYQLEERIEKLEKKMASKKAV
ncbi:hypothetical protein [Domibacillus indicus]|nr:hypothetical protein [Domibacillus indicus]